MKYKQLALSDFMKKFPVFVPYLVNLPIDLSDPEYVVRFDPESIYTKGFELGYESDDWIDFK